MTRPNPLDIAWCAGFIDGEGSMFVTTVGPKGGVQKLSEEIINQRHALRLQLKEA